MSIERSIAAEAENYPALRHLHAGERAEIIDLAIDRLRRRRTYGLVELAALAPGVLLILLTTRQSIQIRHGAGSPGRRALTQGWSCSDTCRCAVGCCGGPDAR